MIKKIFTNALLSMVMDKTARKKLDNMRSGEETLEENGASRKAATSKPAKQQSKKSPKTAKKPKPASDDDILSTITQALEEARQEAVNGSPSHGTRTPRENVPSRAQRSRQATQPVQKPQRQAENRPAPPESTGKLREPISGREKLIADALSIQKRKTRILDELDPAALEKLTLMAQFALDPESLPPEIREIIGQAAKSEGLVDDLGSARKPRIRKR